MKQDEIKTDSQQGDAFYKALRENFTHTTDPYQDLAGYALNDFIGKYINHLLSKKPSVSDEEIKNKAEETYKHSIIEERAFQNGAKWALSLTPPDAEAVMFAEWIYKNYISNGIGKYYHNNWNGDLDTLVNYTTQELFTLYKQGGK